MIFLLSIGYILLTLALNLALLLRSMRRGREENLLCRGRTILVLGFVTEIIIGVIWLTNLVTSEEASILASTALAIALTGGVLAVEGTIRQKPEQLNQLRWWICVLVLLGLASIITYIIV